MPLTPRPGSSWTPLGSDNATPRSWASRTSIAASTCGEACSTEAASANTSAATPSGGVMTATTWARPAVNVPVLSSSTVRVCPIASSAAPSLTTTPLRAAQAIPDTTATGAARTSGHGVATTSTARTRVEFPVASQVPPAIRNTAGTNSTAYRSARRTNGDRPTPADFTSLTIPA